ncbi:purine-nucleoside phosphorylase [Campylobacter corcagiensis]|uniref:Purine-nucleoside phosphorylase n=1 Tax=Campylobacter corcagiensis TaxID=1448857 RepID=A0A7M1LH36_9BACT|nr:purine-nucleoside phosphorylase [Campylobacter corcagiensis]QKF63917.1 putative nucleoside phosphorylase [Campylobacter corcagiensis]QOQ87878.1 purine-nucleoside phosphorylase [Campylobacter corcagiensis]
MIVCAGECESFSFATPIGIGLVNAAINLTKLVLTNKPKELVFIGTAGLYKSGKILEIYESFEARNLEISKILGFSYSPLQGQNLTNVSRETILTNSSNFITTNKELAHKFYDFGFFMENMELYSILEVGKKFEIPSYGILCATNFCDENAHADFIKNHNDAKKRLEEYVKSKGLI